MLRSSRRSRRRVRALLRPLGTVKVTEASPLPSVDTEAGVVVAVAEPTFTVRMWLALNPVTKTVANAPAGADEGMGRADQPVRGPRKIH